MNPAYQRIDLDLSVVRTSSPVVEVGKPYTGITVLAIPAGVNVSIAFGASGQLLPLAAGSVWYDVNGCVLGDEGVFITNPASAGFLTLYVSYSNAHAQGA